MPYYRSIKNPNLEHGKILTPLTDEDFKDGMDHGHFINVKHKAFCVLLYYFAVREAEALRVLREQFQFTRTHMAFEVGPRLKKVKRLKICPQCRTKNGMKAQSCRRCKLDLVIVEPSQIGRPLTTKPLRIRLNVPYVDLLRQAIESAKQGQRVFPYSAKTGYNIVHRAFYYPHLFRLSRITNLLLEGYDLDSIFSFTGLTLAALESYKGLVDNIRIGETLGKPKQVV